MPQEPPLMRRHNYFFNKVSVDRSLEELRSVEDLLVEADGRW